ncbi:MAG: RIP metalloprotease RseP [Patescibacteria group bacterium]
MFTVIIFLLVLAVLIFVHELGHFLAARLFGIRVDAFKLGFGPKVFAWTRGETEYGINLIPFGGFVKIFGENPDDESTHGPDAKRSFVHKAKWKQITVLAAGVFFNFVFAWLLYIITFVGGVTATTSGFEQYADRFENPRVMVSFVSPNSPAEKAGLKLGDIIKNVGTAKSVEEIQNYVNSSQGKPVEVDLERKGQDVHVNISPTQGLVEGKYAMGIAMENVGDLKLPFFAAIKEGTNYFGVMFAGTAGGLWDFFSSIFKGTANFSEVSGPVGIATIVGDSARLGATYLMMITALISINLGIINLVPFPALDGGRIFFILIESIIRRRIPVKFANTVNAVGFALLMLLMVVVTYKDVVKLIW